MKNNKGFTLVEILIALALMGIVTTAIYQLYISQYKTWVSQDIVTEMQQSGRFAMDTMTREMQLAGYNLAPNLHPATEKAVMEASPSKFTFISTDTTITTDSNTKQTRKISFYYDSANQRLKMDVTTWDKSAGSGAGSYGTTETATLAENVTALSFLYFDDQGNTPATVDDVRRIKVSLSVQTSRKDPVTGNYKSMTLVTEARPRNLGIGESITDVTPPATPTGVQIIDPCECRKLKLKWNANTEVDLAGYTIYYSTKPNSDPNFTGYTTRKVAISAYSSYELTGLTTTLSSDATATTYYIRLDAYDTSGNPSTWTAEFSDVVTPANTRTFGAGGNDTTVNISKAPAPTSFTGPGDGGNNAVHLTWVYDTDANPQVTGFRIFRSTAPFGSYPIVPNGDTIKWIAGAPGDPAPNTLGKTAREFTDNDPADRLLGCVTYYYAIAAVPCDTTLISNDAGDDDTKRYIQSDYAATCGDGAAACSPGTGFAAVAGSDTAPSDDGPPPAPTVTPSAGWKAVFLNIESPVREGVGATPDFSHTLVYFSEGGVCPTIDTVVGSPTYGEVSNGFVLPNSDSGIRGRFTTPGVVPPFPHLDDDCIFEDCSDMPLNGTIRNLENASTYCYLGVAYDVCGNLRPVANAVTTLTELCGDDPVGPPGNGSKGGETWPTGATPISVAGCQAGGGLDVSWSTMNHTYPGGYFDGAFYRVHMKGDGDFSGINPTSAITLKAQKQAELMASTTFSSGSIVSGVSDGQSYYFGVTATDCVYENDTLNFPFNYSGWRTKGPITPGELKRDEKINAARDLHREILTGVDINNADGTGTGASTPSTTFRHNTLTLFLENTSAGDMTIEKATVKWINSLAYLTGVTIGGGKSAKNSLPATTIPKASSSTITDDPYTRQISDYSLNNGTIAGLKRWVPITFTFTDFDGNPYVDMRGDQVKITLSVKNDSTGTTTCVSYLTTNDPQAIGDIAVPSGPNITATQQNKPTAPTDGFAVPGGGETANTVPTDGSYASLKVDEGNDVTVTTFVNSGTTDAVTGNKLVISSVKLYWIETSIATNWTGVPSTGWTSVNMTNLSSNEWNATITNPTSGQRVWYYIVATDSDGNYDRAPEINHGYYTFDIQPPDPCEMTPETPNMSWTWAGEGGFDGANWHDWLYYDWIKVTKYTNGSDINKGLDPIKYQVFRNGTMVNEFDEADGWVWTSTTAPAFNSAHNCSGGAALWADCYWYDEIDAHAADFEYYVKAKNSCANPALGISGASSTFRECIGGVAGIDVSITPSSRKADDGGYFLVTIRKCEDAADGGNNDVLNNINITTGSGLDTDIASVTEGWDPGTYLYYLYPTTNAAWNSGWDWSDWGWGSGGGPVLINPNDTVNPSDTITVTVGSATATVNVSHDPCYQNPSAPTGFTGTITGSGVNQVIRLSWTASTSVDKAGYKVYRKDKLKNGTIIDFRVVYSAGSGTLSYDDALGSKNIGDDEYWYYVTTIDSCSTGARESVASGTVPSGATGF